MVIVNIGVNNSDVCKIRVEVMEHVLLEAPNDTTYKRWSCHSRHKLMCKLCQTFQSPATGGPDLPFLGMPAMRTRRKAGAAAHKNG